MLRSGDPKGTIHIDPSPYVSYAAERSKNPWIKEKTPGKFSIYSIGWCAAASFLKR